MMSGFGGSKCCSSALLGFFFFVFLIPVINLGFVFGKKL